MGLFFTTACNHIIPTAPPPPTPTPTAYFIPTSTPGCYSASALPVTQYAYPNPMPPMAMATPFWITPVLGPETISGSSEIDDGSHYSAILRSLAEWNSYWADLGQTAPPPPTNFSQTMVLVLEGQALYRVCYTGTNVVVYQGSGGGGTQIVINPIVPIILGTSPTPTPIPTATPTPTPATLPQNLYLIPASSLPISFVTSYLMAS